MNGPTLRRLLGPRRVLLVAATGKELGALGLAEEVLPREEWVRGAVGGRLDVVISGVGKANAAAATARAIDPGRHGLVLSFGIAGALPGPRGVLAPGTVVVADRCVYADEGLVAEGEGVGEVVFVGLARMGFPPGPFGDDGVRVERGWVEALAMPGSVVGAVATVSTCSGTDAAAGETARRTGAVAEAMEGAAVAQVAARLGVAAGEVRGISNATGARARQGWDIPAALGGLAGWWAWSGLGAG